MSILFRYLAREIFLGTALLLIALLALFALFDLIHELSELGKGNYNLSTLLIYVTLIQPGHVVILVPVAALMGTLLAISRLSTQSELTVMRASGMPLRKICGFAALTGISISALAVLFSEFIAPAAEDLAKQMRLTATSSVVAQQFRSGFWIKDKQSFVNIQTVTAETTLLNMRIYEFDHAYRLQSITTANSAQYGTNNRWMLNDAEKTSFSDKSVRIEKLPTSSWNSEMTPDLLAVLRIKPDQMSISRLSAYIDHLRENKQSTTRYEFALWNKVLQPVTVIIMMLLAIPFAIQSQRMGGVGPKLLIGIMIGLVFYFLNQLIGHLTVLNDWLPLLSATTPILVFFSLVIILLALKEYPGKLWRQTS